MSEYIIQNKLEYYNKLRLVTEDGNWESWMLDMIETTAKKGLIRLKEIINIMQDMTDEIKNKLPKIYSKDLIEIIFAPPIPKGNI